MVQEMMEVVNAQAATDEAECPHFHGDKGDDRFHDRPWRDFRRNENQPRKRGPEVFIVERGNLRPTLDDFLSQTCSIHKDAKHTNGECPELMKAFGAAPAAKKPRAVDTPRNNGGRVNYQRQEYQRRDDNRDDHHDNDRHNNNRHQDDDRRGNRQGHGDNDRRRRDDDEAQALPPPPRDLLDGYQQLDHEVSIIIGGPNAFRPRCEKKVISRVVHAVYTKPVEFLRVEL
jgi:hypothetical protein